MKLRFVLGMFLVGEMVLGAGGILGQDFPNKPIRLVTVAPGAALDFQARLIAEWLSANMGQVVIVDNRSSGNIPGQIVSRATPDGYTLLIYGSGFWTLPLLEKAPYDPVRDFAPITWSGSTPNLIVVHPSVAANSVKELIALAKTKPGELNYASASTGSSSHLAAELFKAMAGVNMVRIPYKGTGPALNDLLAGQVQLTFATAGTVTPHLKSGRLRALAVASLEPSALAPGLPTVAASGLPGYESATNVSLFAPAKTPEAIINRLNQEIVRGLRTANIKEKLLNIGVEAVGSTPEQLAAKIKSDIVRLGKLIKDAGIRASE